jgi:phosphonate transport system substrate-binding protein
MHQQYNGVATLMRIVCCRLFCFFWLIPFTTSVLAGTSGTVPSPDVITFGVVPQQSAGKLARLWTPVFEELSSATGYRIEFRTAPDIPEFERRLARGEYDLAYMNPYHYTAFHRQPGYHAFAKAKDKKLKGIVVVRADSPYREMHELKGQTLAFPSPAAFAASIVTRAYLQNESIPFEAKYVSSHDSVYRSVAKGLYPAGGGVMRTFNNVEDDIREQLRVLWVSPGYTPHAFAAHPRLGESVVQTIRKAMVELDQTDAGRTLLGNLNLKGIVPAENSEWDDIRALNLQLLDDLITPEP